MDYPLLSVAAVVSVNDAGRINAARVVIGAVGPAPLIAHEAGALLLGQDPRKVNLDKVGQTAAKRTQMVDNLVLPASYRKKMIPVFVGRAVEGAVEQAMEHAIQTAPGKENP